MGVVKRAWASIGEYGLREVFAVFMQHVFTEFLPLAAGNIMFFLKSVFFGIKCGRNVSVWGNVCVKKRIGGMISIGDGVCMVSLSKRATAASLYTPVRLAALSKTARIAIGNNVSLSGTSITARSRTIEIGDGTMIAPNVVIIDSDFHALWPPETRITNPGMEDDRDVMIGKNVWIGLNTVILKGVRIGDNSVIGAGSVVTGEIPSGCLFAGNPAKLIKRLSQESD